MNKGKKMLMISLGILCCGIPTIKAEDRDVVAEYDYDNLVETQNPDYLVSIPAGIVFSSVDPGVDIKIDVEMVSSKDGQSVAPGSKADISVASKKGYVVSMDAKGEDDPVEYELMYGSVELHGKGVLQNIGTLIKSIDGKNDVLILKGDGHIKGAASKTGNHTDTLTYYVEDVSHK